MFVHATTKYPDKYLFQLHFRFSTAVDRAQPSTALCTAKSCTEYSQFICSVVEPIGPDSSCTRVKPFSNFDGQQLCSPLTYRPQTFSDERSKLIQNCVKSSRACQYFKGPLKVTSFT